MASINGDKETLLHKPAKKKKNTAKSAAFVIVGGLTLIYCIGELLAALYLGSLTLLSDGFHNLSDVVSLYIAFWAQRAAQRDLSNEMSYGWARTEILGGLTNGCFLLSLCLYITLEAIPKLIQPETSEQLQKAEGGYLFIGIAAIGLIVNIVGTVIFAAVGVSHGHSHSHGHGHGHGHGEASINNAAEHGNEHEHEHGHDDHGHEHAHKDKSHKHKSGEIKEKKKHKDHGHAHKHDKEHKHKHEKEHVDKEYKKDNKLKPKKHDDHAHGHEKGMFSDMDVNTWAVLIHFAGDALSSLFVLATGLVFHFFKRADWTKYLDPIASLLIVILIVTTTVPLVKRCSMILLQSVPSEVDLDAVRNKTRTVEGVISVHDLHVWQLVDGMIIASVHLMIQEGTDVGNVVYQVKQIFHAFGIHSSAIQPEFVKTPLTDPYCAQNCVEECEADWCCKQTADKSKDSGMLQEQYSTFTEPV